MNIVKGGETGRSVKALVAMAKVLDELHDHCNVLDMVKVDLLANNSNELEEELLKGDAVEMGRVKWLRENIESYQLELEELSVIRKALDNIANQALKVVQEMAK